MAVAAWAASTAYSVGAIRRATTAQDSGLVFQCTTAGTSGSSEPTNWGTTIGDITNDNSVVWVAISSVYEDVSVLAPNAIIELFELHLDSAIHGTPVSSPVRWHNGCNANINGNITWNSNAYVRLPIQGDGWDTATSSGTLPRPTLTISNLDSTMTTLLVLVNATTPGCDLGGATVKKIRTLKKYLDGESTADSHAIWPIQQYVIDRKKAETREFVSFELASEFDRPGQMLPKRQIIANVCQWKYRSSECSYTGSNYWNEDDQGVSSLAEDKCGKRVASCKLRFGATSELPYGSFPSAGLTR